MKLLTTILLAFLTFYACGKKSIPPTPPRPTPAPTPVATPAATPAPQVTPAPFSTPEVDLTPYLHQQGGRIMVVETTEDVGAAVNSIDAMLGAEPGKILVRGNGPIKTQIVVSHDLEFQGEYTCDVEDVWRGCILLKDNVTVSGGTIYEPTFISGDQPAIAVFQNFNGPHGLNRSITIKGVKIIGRQTKTDGGVRQSISLGNCDSCAAIGNTLVGVASIGIQFGGGSGEGHHATNGVITGNTIIGAAAAHIAIVNASGMHVWNNTILKPGRVGGPGGVSGVDIETNSADDWAENLWIYNNLFDFSEAAFSGVGSAVLAQQRGSTKSSGLRIVNNRMIGGMPLNGMTSGVFFTGPFPGGIVACNLIQRSGQAGLQLYGSEGVTFEDNILTNVGGGGLPAIYISGGGRNVFRRNPVLYLESIGGSASGEIWVIGSQENQFDTDVVIRATAKPRKQ